LLLDFRRALFLPPDRLADEERAPLLDFLELDLRLALV
jgi:hypothetical protein